MSNYNSQLQSNNTDLQAILNSINELPEAGGGINLPNLTNEGSASDLLSGKEFINSSGNKVTGTFSIDNELNTQDDLISQLQAVVDSLPEAGSGSGSGGSSGDDIIETCTVEVSTNDSLSVIYSTTDESGKIVTAWTSPSNTHSLTVVCDSYIFIPVISTVPDYNINGSAEFIEILSGYSSYRTMVFKINGTSTINCYDND